MFTRVASAIVLGLVLVSVAPSAAGAAGKPGPVASGQAACAVVGGEKHLSVSVTWSKVKAARVYAWANVAVTGSLVDASSSQARETTRGTLTTPALSGPNGSNVTGLWPDSNLRWELYDTSSNQVAWGTITGATVQAILDSCS